LFIFTISWSLLQVLKKDFFSEIRTMLTELEIICKEKISLGDGKKNGISIKYNKCIGL
jgi:hypothetical protein